MKEIPMLFSGPMVRAILEGRKTQTRRVVKPQPIDDPSSSRPWVDEGQTPSGAGRVGRSLRLDDCHFGVPGDRLWVREAWRPRVSAAGSSRGVQYRADGSINVSEMPSGVFNVPTECIPLELWHPSAFVEFKASCDRWRPSIHMPRIASRITLEVVSVRVELLQEISDSDAIAEGVQKECDFYGDDKMTGWHRYDGKACAAPTVVLSFASLWDSVYGKGSWELNPWVWVVEFRRDGAGGVS